MPGDVASSMLMNLFKESHMRATTIPDWEPGGERGVLQERLAR